MTDPEPLTDEETLDAMRVPDGGWPPTDDFRMNTAQDWIERLYRQHDADREQIAELKEDCLSLIAESEMCEESNERFRRVARELRTGRDTLRREVANYKKGYKDENVRLEDDPYDWRRTVMVNPHTPLPSAAHPHESADKVQPKSLTDSGLAQAAVVVLMSTDRNAADCIRDLLARHDADRKQIVALSAVLDDFLNGERGWCGNCSGDCKFCKRDERARKALER